LIGTSVTSIGRQAFQYCSNLSSIPIVNAVTTIGSSAFDDCGCDEGLYRAGVAEVVQAAGLWGGRGALRLDNPS